MPSIELVQQKNPELGKELEELRAALEVTPDELAKRLDAVLAEPYLSSYPEDERLIHGVKVLKAQSAALLMSDAQPYLVRVFAVKNAKTIQRKEKGPLTIGGLVGIGYPKDEPAKVGIVSLSAFDDVAGRLADVKLGKTYEVRGTVAEDAVFNAQKPIHNITGDETLRPVEHTGPFAMPPSVAEFLKKLYPHVLIKDAEANLTKKNVDGKLDYTDQKLIHGTIVYAVVRSGKNGPWGQFQLIDPSLTASELKKRGGAFGVMVEPSQVRFGPGTEVICVGTITKREKDGKTYLGMNSDMVVPATNFFIERTPTIPSSAAPTVGGGAATAVKAEAVDLTDFE